MSQESLQHLENYPVSDFQQNLIEWFQAEQRILPWRESKDPYRIWVSEIMLQQTKVDTVIPFYLNFLEKFPTPKALAEAEEDEVLKAWEGLGYYSRARNLQTAVKEVQEVYGGKVPNDPEKIKKLKGVGPYTTGAISSIAFGIPEPAVDGNVMRVMSRVLWITEDIARPATRKTFEAAIREVISHEDPSSFNQGLMELGALICTPTKPKCLLCPVREQCVAFENGVQEELPVKSKKSSTKSKKYTTLVIQREDEKYLVEKRPATGLLAGLYQFPMIEQLKATDARATYIQAEVEREYGLAIQVESDIFTEVHHIFSHLKWDLEVRKAKTTTLKTPENMVWLTAEELHQFAFPVPHQKIRQILN